MTMKMSCDWIVGHDGTCGDMAYALECLRCGTVQRVASPIAVDLYVAMSKAFERMHSHCRRPTKRQGQDNLPCALSPIFLSLGEGMDAWPVALSRSICRIACFTARPTFGRLGWDGGRNWVLPGGFWLETTEVEFLTGATLWEIDEAQGLEIVIRRGNSWRGLRADWRFDGDDWILFFPDQVRHIRSLSRALSFDAAFERMRDEPKLMVEGTLIHADPH
jgi:hypothetical protein